MPAKCLFARISSGTPTWERIYKKNGQPNQSGWPVPIGVRLAIQS